MGNAPAKTTGTLFICPTPIGNLEDITLRVLRALKEADLIAAENTAYTQKLLNHFSISKPLISYYDSGDATAKEEKLLHKLKQGLSIALVSSAGTPLVNDPGYRLVRRCVAENVPVIALPGPSAAITALVASGLPPHPFFFGGFLPPKSKARQDFLSRIADYDGTLIFYEAPHRIHETLEDARQILGDRPAALARELTKIHEEVVRGKLSEILESFSKKPAKGEITLIIGPRETAPLISADNLREELQILIRDGISVSEACRRLSKKHALSKNKIYALAHRPLP